MPLYSFHVDVPAPPDVVEARIRAVVRDVPSSWERIKSSWKAAPWTSFPFQGTVGDHSFRIQRTIRTRNSSPPIIRGKIVSTLAGSRVNVFMYMQPFTIIFLLAWVGILAFTESRAIESNPAASYFPLGILAFGIAGSVASFIYEVVKAKALLSQAVLNLAIATAPEASQESQVPAPMAPPAPEKPHGSTLVFAVAAIVMVGALAAPKLYESHLRSSPAFAAVVDEASRSSVVKAALGEPLTAGAAVRGMVHQGVESGYTILAIPMSGPRGKGTLYAVANRIENGWDIEREVLRRDSGSGAAEGIDLTPPTQREPFRYPAVGRVYLLPLDDAAASDLKDLPGYYKALLDLDVTVLETQKLGSDCMDAKAKQVIAEKALDSIEQTHREIAEDLDSEILGVTSQDMNIPTAGWNFATNYRRGRFGIVSTARLHGMPWYAGTNPEIYGIRVRKIVTKNLAVLHYPLELSTDVSSSVATSAFTSSDFDQMGEKFDGEFGGARSLALAEPCVAIEQGPNGKQSWRLDCVQNPPDDTRFEMFQTYPDYSLLVLSRTDFSFRGLPYFAFTRRYRPKDNLSRTFGIGGNDSFDIFLVGNSQTFSWIDLILSDGQRAHYRRTSFGIGVGNARLRADSAIGSRFSPSSLVWDGNGWDITTDDGWKYRFPSSGPDRTWKQGALTGINSSSGKTFAMDRNDASDLRELRAPDGTTIAFTYDDMHRMLTATQSPGRALQYEYDSGGRLAHVHDPQNGDEFYEYDSGNRLTSVLGARHQRLLVNTYGSMGEVTSQTLADGRKLIYESGFNHNNKLNRLKLTLPNGYTIEWEMTRGGLTRGLPKAPGGADEPARR